MGWHVLSLELTNKTSRRGTIYDVCAGSRLFGADNTPVKKELRPGLSIYCFVANLCDHHVLRLFSSNRFIGAYSIKIILVRINVNKCKWSEIEDTSLLKFQVRCA
jgi:hypothetical protein